MTHTNQPTATVAKDGNILVTQGRYRPALYIARHEVPRFLADPTSAAITPIPPFAATALQCYLTDVTVASIRLTPKSRDRTVFSLTFQLPARRIAYCSSSAALADPKQLASQGIELVITPHAIASISAGNTGPFATILSRVLGPATVHYEQRFVVLPSIIRDLVAEAIHKAQPLFYEN